MGAYPYNLGLQFECVAREAGEAAALICGVERISYAQLDALSNQLSAVLRESGLQKRDVLGIVHDKSPVAYAAMLAALKLGAAYVNIDDQNPAPRLAHIFGSSKPRLVTGVTLTPPLLEACRAAGATVLHLAQDGEAMQRIHAASQEAPRGLGDVTGSDPAYIMYTSGSTGVPKGAVMTHAGVLNFGRWIGTRFGVGRDDVLTNVNPMYFDNSVFDFYGAMLNGAALAPVVRETLADPSEMLRQVEAAKCTVWFSVPSLLVYVMTLKLLTSDRLPAVRSFVFGGEGYPKPELRKLHALYGHRSLLINVYGPTECTCMCSAYDVTAADLEDPNGFVTLGTVCDNFSMQVLDGEKSVKIGEVGELCLLGPQVGLGYANDAERTARAFVQNPYENRFVEKMYRTGDLVRLGIDGRLDFVGRKDNQIKHMGYRIELEEIESGLNQIDGVTQSAVLLRAAKRGTVKQLVAYVAIDRPASAETLRKQLEQFLPPYMIPQRFEVRGALPKNANGKIDKIALATEPE